MNYYLSALMPNCIGIFILLVVLANARRKTVGSVPEKNAFYSMVYLCILQCVLETVSFLFNGKIGWIVWGSNALLFINTATFSFLWTIYADVKMFADKKRVRRRNRFLAIPAAVVVLGVIVNFFTPVFFRIDADNLYQRTSLITLCYVVAYAYLVYGLALIYKNRRLVGKYLFLPAIVFITPTVLGSLLQFLFYGVSLMWVGTAIGIMSLYINLQNEVSSIDLLSGLFTRQHMSKYLISAVKSTGDGSRLAGIMLDIDRFKRINDTYGHLVGDEAIGAAGKILRTCAGTQAMAVRFAGDEFIIILHIRHNSEIQKMIQQIQEQTEAFNARKESVYTLSFSIGSAVYNPKKDTIDSFLNRIDKAMYVEKQKKRL